MKMNAASLEMELAISSFLWRPVELLDKFLSILLLLWVIIVQPKSYAMCSYACYLFNGKLL